MRDPRLGRRYAEALYAAARDAGVAEEVVDAFEQTIAPLEQDPHFLAFWRGRRVPEARRFELVDELFGNAPAPVTRFLKLLLAKKREEVLFDVIPALRMLHDRERGVVRATLTTAVDLGENDLVPFRELLADRLGGQVTLTHKVDPGLVAGFKLRYGDRIIDGSVSRSISELRRRLSA